MNAGYTLRYSCKRCGLEDAEFSVRYRRDGEDLIEWMEGIVRPAMGAAHSKRSPLCMSQHADLKMPLSDAAGGVGMKPKGH